MTTKPQIKMTWPAFQKAMAYVDIAHQEIGWFGKVQQEDNVFTIVDTVLLKQKCNSVETDISTDAINNLLVMAAQDASFDPEGVRNWGHSHVNMGAFHSGTDLEAIKNLGEGWKYVISTVFNKRREYDCRMDVFWPFHYSFEKLDIEFMYPQMDEAARKIAELEVANKVEFYVPPAVTPTVYGQGEMGFYRGGSRAYREGCIWTREGWTDNRLLDKKPSETNVAVHGGEFGLGGICLGCGLEFKLCKCDDWCVDCGADTVGACKCTKGFSSYLQHATIMNPNGDTPPRTLSRKEKRKLKREAAERTRKENISALSKWLDEHGRR